MSDEPDPRDAALESSEAAADRSFDRSSATGAVQSCAPSSTWVDIKLVDEEGEPIAGARFQVFRPDGTLLGSGRLGRDGCGGFENIEQLDYTVCFPDLDEDAWAPAARDGD
ncbi:MAG: hypothetical protein AB1Z98_15435 [Nannocystaceae bacterium]